MYSHGQRDSGTFDQMAAAWEKNVEKMNAAVVNSFDEPPHYQEFEVPRPTNDHEILVDVLAVGLHPRTRSGAAGIHCTGAGELPMIPGIDGVGQRRTAQRSISCRTTVLSGRWPTRRSPTCGARSNFPAMLMR
jgi:hypothetical protein